MASVHRVQEAGFDFEFIAHKYPDDGRPRLHFCWLPAPAAPPAFIGVIVCPAKRNPDLRLFGTVRCDVLMALLRIIEQRRHLAPEPTPAAAEAPQPAPTETPA